MPKHHDLKTKQPFFSDVKSGRKMFEVRQYTAQACGNCSECEMHWDQVAELCLFPKPARDFQIGDTIRLHELNGEQVSGLFEIQYILRDTDYPDGIKEGYCILGLKEHENGTN